MTPRALSDFARQCDGALCQPSLSPDDDQGAWADIGGPLAAVMGSLDSDRLARGLRRPFAACIEYAYGEAHFSRLCGDLARTGGLCLSLCTVSAYNLEPSHAFCRALAERIGLTDDRCSDIETAVFEAVANGLVHGNLEVDSSGREHVEKFMAFCTQLETRLSDAQYAARRLELCAQWDEQTVTVTVTDEGPGYDFATRAAPDDANRKSGRGLLHIRHFTNNRVVVDNGGRSMTMVFDRLA